jgi:protocatechuate 3,4-dioxygenase beta subunit
MGQNLRQMPDATRRDLLGLLGAAGLIPLVGCGEEAPACAEVIPTETAGPFPGRELLAMPDAVRSDLRASIGDATGVAAGVAMTLTLTIIDTAAGCAPAAGAAVHLWQCDAAGAYSMYAGSAAEANYLRGVQVCDADGRVTFTTIVPGCYPGRWPHLHLEVYPSLAAATGGGEARRTSQLAFPASACELAYATAGYEASATALADVTLAGDLAFRDDVELQLATVTGDAAGMVASIEIAI